MEDNLSEGRQGRRRGKEKQGTGRQSLSTEARLRLGLLCAALRNENLAEVGRDSWRGEANAILELENLGTWAGAIRHRDETRSKHRRYHRRCFISMEQEKDLSKVKSMGLQGIRGPKDKSGCM